MTGIELGTIMMLVSLCKDAVLLRKWQKARTEALTTNKLSNHEAELLHAAAKDGRGDGEIQLVMISGTLHIWIDGKTFTGTPYELAKYFDAFTSLCERGFVRYSGSHDATVDRGIFTITGEAFDLDIELHGGKPQSGK